jgi:hypothetical protein
MSAHRVARLIRLAESPEIIQQAVTPGLLMETTDREGAVRKERRKMELTVALAACAYYRHHERANDAVLAKERTEKLLVRALKGNWTRAKLEAEVKRLTGAGAGAETQPDAETETTDPGIAEREPEGTKRLLFRNRGNQWVLYPHNIARAQPDELRQLVTHLQKMLSDASAVLAAHQEGTR